MNGKRELLAIPDSFCCLDLESDFLTSPRRLRKGSFLSQWLRIPVDEFDGTYWEHRCAKCEELWSQIQSGVRRITSGLASSPLSALCYKLEMPKNTEQWFLFQYQNGKVAPLSKGFKTKQLAEKARLKYPERERKQIGVGVVRVEL
jgi:hypothetical protein